MTEEFDKLIRPIRNASAPGTLAALLSSGTQSRGRFPSCPEIRSADGAIMFLLSAFFIFFYSIYPTRKTLWTGTAVTFLFGLLSLVSSAVVLLFIV
jgi:hypothetical protein